MKTSMFAFATLSLLAPLGMAQLPPAPAAAAQTIYGHVTGLSCNGAGNSAFPGFIAFKFTFADAVTLSSGGGPGGGGPTGRPTFPNISVTKGLDDCTPLLFGAVAKGTTFRTVTLTVVSGAPAATLMLITLQDVQFASEGFSEDSADSNARDLDEVVTMAYSKITITHVASGKTFSWDLQRNTPF